jgi:hypothetical protein
MFTRAAVFTAVVASAAAFQPTLRAGVAPKVRLRSRSKKFRRALGDRFHTGLRSIKMQEGRCRLAAWGGVEKMLAMLLATENASPLGARSSCTQRCVDASIVRRPIPQDCWRNL